MVEGLSTHWFELVQTIAIIGGLVFSAYTLRKDETARRISNLIAVSERYGHIWQEFYDRPDLARILKNDTDLKKKPVTDAEWLFVKLLMLHLDTVYRAMKAGMFVEIEGLEKDIGDFLTLPIPKSVWNKIKPFQSEDFVNFVETVTKSVEK